MPNPKLLGIVTALLMAVATPSAHAAFSAAEIKQIEELVTSQQWDALRAFVKAHPKLLKGNNALANALKPFMKNGTQNAVIGLFSEASTSSSTY